MSETRQTPLRAYTSILGWCRVVRNGWEIPVEKTVARLNIERFRKKLSEDADETTRQTLLHLLAEEEAKLAELTPTEVAGRR